MSDARPTIGICTSLEHARWGVWDQRAALLPFGYITAIQRAGGLAVMIPPDPVLSEHPDEMLDQLDGLILAGGADIDPSAYDAEPASRDQGHGPRARPLGDRAGAPGGRARHAGARDLPRDAADQRRARRHAAPAHPRPRRSRTSTAATRAASTNSDHDVRLEEGSLAARAAGEELHGTKSHHHQGVDEIGEGLVVTGVSTLDDLPEAIEAPACRFVLGVQWHPEADEESRVVGALVEEARAYRAAQV